MLISKSILLVIVNVICRYKLRNILSKFLSFKGLKTKNIPLIFNVISSAEIILKCYVLLIRR